MKSPAAILAGVAVTIFLGLFALYRLPVELLPEIARPEIGVETDWRAQTPREVENQIVEPEEQVLQQLPGLEKMEAHANFGESYITLTFPLGTNIDNTLVDVIGRLDRIQTLPVDAQKPLAEISNKKDQSAVLLSIFLQKLPGNADDLAAYQSFLRDMIVPRLQGIPGVGAIHFTGEGATDELQIVFNPMRAAQLAIQIPKAAFQIGNSDDVSGGAIDVGRHRYGLSFRGRYSIDELKHTVLDWRSGNPVLLGDIADVHVGQARQQGLAYHDGHPALKIDVFRAPGANVLSTVRAIKAALKELNAGAAKDRAVVLEYAADITPFIRKAVGLVTFDIFLGALLAIGVLWFFMREWHATFVVSSAIPICICAVLVLLLVFGRSLNVISLAGLAVATGLMLDPAIVVVENILRLREAGEPAEKAAHDGTHEIWRALFASTVTNVAIFLPVIFLRNIEGQIFSDIALTFAFSVLVSFIVAIAVVPVASSLFMKTQTRVHELSGVWGRIASRVMDLTDQPRERLAWIVALIVMPLFAIVLLFPKVHYLPYVKRGAINVALQYPPGATLDFVDKEIAQPLIKRLTPYLAESGDPKIADWYLSADTTGAMTVALRMQHGGDFDRMEDILRSDVLKGLPDTQGFATENNLFGGLDEGETASIDIQANDADAMRNAARTGFDLLTAQFPGAVVTAQPALYYDEPQLELKPNDRAISEAGWTRVDVANLLQALGEGLYVGQRFEDGEQLYLILKSQSVDSASALQNTPVMTPQGTVAYFGSLVSVERTLAPSAIYSLNGLQTYALNITPPDNLALGDVLSKVRADVEPKIRAALPAGSTVTEGAAAGELGNALWAIGENFLLAVVILFLIMTALFRSLKDAAIAAIGLPLGAAGGVIALRLLGLFVFQPLDLLTVIGFLIVLGLVVNNTILLVARTRQAEAEGLSRDEAVRSSLETRLRPIFSSTLTAVAGMLPLLLISGAGSEIYRGLSAVVIGGVLLSSVFTVFLIPALLRLGEPVPATTAQSEPATVNS
ncbi:MAG TPA: efflux RND transporter permease subunit [Rhizomicrobium sp.]